MLSGVDLKLLEIFCCVCEEGSFSRAAERLGLTQPTISEHVKTLENYFQTPLFDRLGRHIRPTGAGELLYSRGRSIVEMKQSVVDVMRHYLNGAQGELRIGASNIPGEYLLPRVIGRFHRTHPNVRVRVVIGDSEQIVDGVIDGTYEIGFVGSRPRQPGLDFEKFASDRLVLAVPRSKSWTETDEIALAELMRMPLLVREQGSGTRVEVEHWLHAHGAALADFNVVAEMGSTAAIKEAIRENVGASIISDLAVAADVAAGRMRILPIREMGTLVRDFFRVVDPRRIASPVRGAFLDVLAHFGEPKRLRRGTPDHSKTR